MASGQPSLNSFVGFVRHDADRPTWCVDCKSLSNGAMTAEELILRFSPGVFLGRIALPARLDRSRVNTVKMRFSSVLFVNAIASGMIS